MIDRHSQNEVIDMRQSGSTHECRCEWNRDLTLVEPGSDL